MIADKICTHHLERKAIARPDISVPSSSKSFIATGVFMRGPLIEPRRGSAPSRRLITLSAGTRSVMLMDASWIPRPERKTAAAFWLRSAGLTTISRTTLNFCNSLRRAALHRASNSKVGPR
jgi:hypothetical protein